MSSEEYQEVDSLPSPPTSPTSSRITSSSAAASSSSITLSETDAEREWKESLQQIELLLSLVIVPYLGKFFGRKFAYWSWKRFMEWKYPVELVFATTSPLGLKGAGVFETAASL